MMRKATNFLFCENLPNAVSQISDQSKYESTNIRENFAKHDRFFTSYDFSLISQRGFLPGKDPIDSIPNLSPLNMQLNDIAKNIPDLIKNHQLINKVDELNTQYAECGLLLEKGNKQQENAAILFLVSIAQAYIWENNENPRNKIPRVIAKNLYNLCRSQQRFPTLTYSDYVLHNWRLIDPTKEISLDNIEPIITFTGSKDELWFIKIHVAIEAVCSKAMHAACQVFNLANDMKKNPGIDLLLKEKELIKLLTIIENSIKDATCILQKMKDNCDPNYFFFQLRPYLSGWEKVKTEVVGKEEIGVHFEGVDNKDKISTYNYKGPSGAQSSIFPALDALLGIKHEINGMYRTLLEFQEYMPKKHAAFIKLLTKSKLSHIADSNDFTDLKTARANAIHQLELFRAHHIGIVHQFIFNQAAKIGIDKDEITGTGGTPINEYLCGRYKTTLTSR